MSFLCVVLDARRNLKEKTAELIFYVLGLCVRQRVDIRGTAAKNEFELIEVGCAYKLNPRKRPSTNFI